MNPRGLYGEKHHGTAVDAADCSGYLIEMFPRRRRWASSHLQEESVELRAAVGWIHLVAPSVKVRQDPVHDGRELSSS